MTACTGTSKTPEPCLRDADGPDGLCYAHRWGKEKHAGRNAALEKAHKLLEPAMDALSSVGIYSLIHLAPTEGGKDWYPYLLIPAEEALELVGILSESLD